MKSYFGSYSSSPGAEPLHSSVLIFDKNLNIGFRNPDGTTTTLDWALKDITVSFDFSTQATRLKYANSGAEVLIQGNDAAAFVKELQAEQQKVWYKKSGAKEWIRNLTACRFIRAVGFIIPVDSSVVI